MDDAAATPVLVSVVAFLGMGVIFGAVGTMLKKGRITRNNAVGIRTSATLASDEAWERGHEAGAPWILASALASAVATLAGLLVLLLTGFEPGETVTAAVILGGLALIIALLTTAGVVAHRSAQVDS